MSEAQKVITPTPGRVVWYHPSQDEINAAQFACSDPSQPLAATVAYVWNDRMVNLSVVDQNGNQFRRTSVALVQPGDEPKHTSEGPFATWMPYQIGQAKAAADVGTVGEQEPANRTLTDEESAALVPLTPESVVAAVSDEAEPARKWTLREGQWAPTDEILSPEQADELAVARPDGSYALAPIDLQFERGYVRLWADADSPTVAVASPEYSGIPNDAPASQIHEVMGARIGLHKTETATPFPEPAKAAPKGAAPKKGAKK